jgi:voltage-gated potassium channel
MPLYRIVDHQRGHLLLNQWKRALIRAVVLLGATVLACTIGLMLMDPGGGTWSQKGFSALWNAANTVSTLGDFTDFTRAQQAYMMLTMFAFLLIGGYAMTTLTGILSSDEVRAFRENRTMTKMLETLHNHAIVVGFGPVGRLVAQRLKDLGSPVVVIDAREGPAQEASGLGYAAILGDAGAEEETLQQARIDSARALFVTTEDPDRKVTITLMAHAANPKLMICVTGQDQVRGALLRRAGASDVVVVDTLIAGALIEQLKPVAG